MKQIKKEKGETGVWRPVAEVASNYGGLWSGVWRWRLSESESESESEKCELWGM